MSETVALSGIHIFNEKLRFTSGGKQAFPIRLWAENNVNVGRVRNTLRYYLHG